MTRQEEIDRLFRKYFETDNLLKRGTPKTFHCCDEVKCSVNQHEEPIWTPYIGDVDTDIMIVAEAPSITGHKGPHIAGQDMGVSFLLDKNKRDEGLNALKEFVQESIDKKFHRLPYFTDLIKCGVVNQGREEKGKLKKRLPYCTKRFLLKEINIINPRIIICVGNMANDFMEKNNENNIKIIKLIHYSAVA